MTFVFLLFFGLVVGLAALPLLPAILEWRQPTDTAPLRVVQDSEVDIRHLADGFRAWVERTLAEPLARSRQTASVVEGERDGTRFVVLPDGRVPFPADDEARAARSGRVLASGGDLRIPDRATLTREVYAAGSVAGGAGTVLRAVLADGDVELGADSRTLRWLHADGSVVLGPGCRSHGRVSAGTGIVLSPGCGFERLGAPRVMFGSVATEPGAAPPRELPLLAPSEVRQGVVIETDAGRWLVKGNAEIPADSRVEADLIVTGRCRLRQGSVIAGGVKSHGDLVLEDDVEVRGGAVSARNLVVGQRCRIGGPVVAERAMDLGSGTTIGVPELPTTVTARDLRVASGVVSYGTVWAHRQGEVSGTPPAGSGPGMETA